MFMLFLVASVLTPVQVIGIDVGASRKPSARSPNHGAGARFQAANASCQFLCGYVRFRSYGYFLYCGRLKPGLRDFHASQKSLFQGWSPTPKSLAVRRNAADLAPSNASPKFCEALDL